MKELSFFVVLAITFIQISNAQIQKGGDLYGLAPNDACCYGIALSEDGNTIAIGSHLNDDRYSDAGKLRVFRWVNNNWIKLGQDINGEFPGDWLGASVDLTPDGNTLVVGVFAARSPVKGRVVVYDWNGRSWAQVGSVLEGDEFDDRFGWSVSISDNGNSIAAGAYRHGNDIGLAKVYDWNGSDWTQRGANIEGAEDRVRFGWSASISSDGSKLAVGAPYSDGGGVRRGQVKVYQWDGRNWIQMGNSINGESDLDQSGHSLAMSSDGNSIAIGAPGNDGNGEDSGHVRVYDWKENSWKQRGQDIDGENIGDFSAELRLSMSSDGNIVAIGATLNDGGGDNSGHVRVYKWNNSSWEQFGSDIDGESSEDWTGSSVSLSSDGKTLAIGERGNDRNGNDSGRVRVFEMKSNATQNIHKNFEISITPNPTTGVVTVSSAKLVNNVTIVPIAAPELNRRVYSGSYNTQFDIDISELPSGIYFIIVQTLHGEVVRKIVKN